MSDSGAMAEAQRGAYAALRSLPVAVARCSAELRYVWMSGRYAEWIGLPWEEAVGRSIEEALGRECLASMRPHIEAVLAGRPIERDAEVHHERLGTRWVHVDCVPTFDSSGACDGWIEAISDVTERHRMEQRLLEHEEILQSYYDSSPYFMGLAELDGDSPILLYTNRALASVYGATPEQMLHRRGDELGTPEEVRLWVESYRRSQRERTPVQFEYERRPSTGSQWLRASAAFLGVGQNGRPRFSFIAEEITEHKKVVEALQEANRAKDEFLAMLGHELRNPLAPIVTALQLLKLRGNGPYAKTLAVVDRQVRYLIRLVDDLLDVSRITRGAIQIKKRRLLLSDVVAQGVEMALPLVEERRHHLDVDVPELRVTGDEGRLAQVVANLLTNSAKYTDPGGYIAIHAFRQGDQIVLVVKDTGVGISPKLLPHVFDMFTQERQSADRSRGGLGLGLTIVRKLVELHGGTVEVESEGIGKGSAFTVRLPAAAAEPAAVEFVAAKAPEGTRASRRILVVDDNEDALELLAEVLRSAGHLVVTAKDGPGALEALARFPVDVAVLDIGLPVMDGYELAGRIRAAMGASTPRLIALTGYGRDSDRAKARQAGFAHHLTKPVEVSRLLGTIEAVRAEEHGELDAR